MANEQHIEWLLEGVEAWNARRQRDDFVPDFSNVKDLQARFKAAGLVSYDRRMNLHRADLREANLRKADLWGADLRVADLRGADLRAANLRKANLWGAELGKSDLRAAKLNGANIKEADVEEADVRTVCSGVNSVDGVSPEYTDLSGVISPTQAQLDTIRGDRGVILPDIRGNRGWLQPEGLTYPDHWPEPLPPGAADNVQDETQDPRSDRSPGSDARTERNLDRFRDHVRLLTALGPVAREAAAQTAAQIEWAIAEYRKEAGQPNRLPDELEAYHQMGAYLLDISRLLADLDAARSATDERETQIKILEARVADLTAQVTTLNTALANTKDTAVKQVIVASVGAAGGAILTGIALTGGSHVADGIRHLHDLIQSWGMSAPPPSPSFG